MKHPQQPPLPSATTTVAPRHGALATTAPLQEWGSITHRSFNEQQTPQLDDDDTTNDNDVDEWPLPVKILVGVLLLGWLIWIVITFALLGADSTQRVHGLCGKLWEYMLVRTLCMLAELLQVLFVFRSGDDGCYVLVLGDDESTLWTATLLHCLYNAGFALAGAIIVPAAVVDAAPCCTNALAEASFTGTYTLASFAWVFLALDSAQVVARATWLLQRHKEMRASDPYASNI